MSLSIILQMHGHNVEMAHDGSAALEISRGASLRRHPPGYRAAVDRWIRGGPPDPRARRRRPGPCWSASAATASRPIAGVPGTPDSTSTWSSRSIRGSWRTCSTSGPGQASTPDRRRDEGSLRIAAGRRAWPARIRRGWPRVSPVRVEDRLELPGVERLDQVEVDADFRRPSTIALAAVTRRAHDQDPREIGMRTQLRRPPRIRPSAAGRYPAAPRRAGIRAASSRADGPSCVVRTSCPHIRRSMAKMPAVSTLSSTTRTRSDESEGPRMLLPPGEESLGSDIHVPAIITHGREPRPGQPARRD